MLLFLRRSGPGRPDRGEATLSRLHPVIGLAAALALAAAAGGAERRFELQLAAGKLVGERNAVRVNRGDRVELRWTSDRPMVLHLHGYDLEAEVTPGMVRTMSFTAEVAGRFPVSEHRHGGKHGRALLYLEVHP